MKGSSEPRIEPCSIFLERRKHWRPSGNKTHLNEWSQHLSHISLHPPTQKANAKEISFLDPYKIHWSEQMCHAVLCARIETPPFSGSPFKSCRPSPLRGKHLKGNVAQVCVPVFLWPEIDFLRGTQTGKGKGSGSFPVLSRAQVLTLL